MNSLYWDHLLEYEVGQLRRLFVEEMGRLLPCWSQHWREGYLKRDFESALANVDRSWALVRVRKWLDAYINGAPISFAEME